MHHHYNQFLESASELLSSRMHESTTYLVDVCQYTSLMAVCPCIMAGLQRYVQVLAGALYTVILYYI